MSDCIQINHRGTEVTEKKKTLVSVLFSVPSVSLWFQVEDLK